MSATKPASRTELKEYCLRRLGKPVLQINVDDTQVEDLIDWAIPMAYTRDDRLLRYQLEHFANRPHSDRILGGLGVWLFASTPENALHQRAIAQEAGLPGEVLFSYDSIVDAPALHSALSQASDPPPALAP